MNDILNRFGRIANGMDINNVLSDGDDTAIVMDSWNNLSAKSKSDCLARHMFIVSDATQDSIDENNQARTAFYNAVASLFTPRVITSERQDDKSYLTKVNVGRPNIPESVLKELEMGNFKLNDEGKATSGKPLTARRVKSVLNAIAKVMPNLAPLAKKTQTLQQDIEALGGTADSLPADSDERTKLVGKIKVDINHELNEFFSQHKLSANGRADPYRQACRNRLDSLTQAIIHSGDVKVGEWSKAAITRATRAELAKIKIPESVKSVTKARPFWSEILPTGEERGIKPSSLVKAIGNYPELFADNEEQAVEQTVAFKDYAEFFFVQHSREFRDFVDSLPGGHGLLPAEADSLLDAAMNKFMTFVSMKKEADRNVSMDDFQRFFSGRDDIAAGLFKDALVQVFDNREDHNELTGETARLFKDESFSSVVRAQRPVVVQPPVEEVKVEPEPPKPAPVKTCEQIFACLFEKTGKYSVEEIVNKKAKNYVDENQFEKMLQSAKDFVEEQTNRIRSAFSGQLTPSQQEILETYAWRLYMMVDEAMFHTMNTDYFGAIDRIGGEKFAHLLDLHVALTNRLNNAARSEASNCELVEGLEAKFENLFNESFADKLNQKLNAKNRQLPVSTDELRGKLLPMLKSSVKSAVVLVTCKLKGLPKSIVEDLEKAAAEKIESRFAPAIEDIAKRIADNNIASTSQEWNLILPGLAHNAWTSTDD